MSGFCPDCGNTLCICPVRPMTPPEQHDRIHDWPSELRRPEGDEQPAPANRRHTGIERLTQDDLCGMLPTEIVTYIDVLADERDALLALVAEPRAAAPPSDLDAEAAAHQEHCRLPSCGLCSACLLPWPCLVRRLVAERAELRAAGNAMAETLVAAANAVERRCLVQHRGCISEGAIVRVMRERADAWRAPSPTTGGAAGEGERS